MAEETPGGECQLSNSKEEFQSGWRASCFMKPQRGGCQHRLYNLGCGTIVGWERGMEGRGSAAILAPLVFSSLVMVGWVGSKD